MIEIEVKSSLDGSTEKSLLHLPPGGKRLPLVVGLHTWSFDRSNQESPMLPLAERYGWALLLPEFRGPNLESNPRAPEACGSDAARRDIVDAVRHVLSEYGDAVDPAAVFLLGGSGGGHMGLLMAAQEPTLWRAVSVWCPITDLTAWHAENKAYRPHLERCCGGKPERDERTALEYRRRSPVSASQRIALARVSIHHGKWDPVVPYAHSMAVFRRIMEAAPEARVFLDIFDGGHEIRHAEAFRWFEESLGRKTGGGLSG